MGQTGGGVIPSGGGPHIESGRSGTRRWWRVGGNRVELLPEGPGYTARVWRNGWGPEPLVVDGHFAGEAEAVAWCERMARVLAEDLVDEADPEGLPPGHPGAN